jgi:hypothetical protein
MLLYIVTLLGAILAFIAGAALWSAVIRPRLKGRAEKRRRRRVRSQRG